MTKLSLLTTISLSLMIAINSANAQSAIGKAEEIKTRISGSKSGNLRENSNIFANERIRSNRSGMGHFRFTDGTKLVVGPGSNLVLDELVYNPGGSTFKKIVLDSVSGATRFISGKSRSSAFKIVTPVGVMGLRGTAFDFQHLAGRTYLMLLDGRVEFCSQSGQCQTIRRRCDFVVIAPNGDISDPKQPRNSLFTENDMERYFPFVNDQRQLLSDYRLRVNRCAGGGYEAIPRGTNDQNTGNNTTTPSSSDDGEPTS